MSDDLKEKLRRAWNSAGDVFLTALFDVLQTHPVAPVSPPLVVSPVPGSNSDDGKKKRPLPVPNKRRILRKPITRKGKKSPSDQSDGDSSEEETYVPPTNSMVRKVSKSEDSEEEKAQESSAVLPDLKIVAPATIEPTPVAETHTNEEVKERIENELFGSSQSSSEDAQSDESKSYSKFDLSTDSVLSLLTDLRENADDNSQVSQIIKKMEEWVQSEEGQSIAIFRETKALLEIKKLLKTMQPENANLCQRFLDSVKERLGKSQPDDSEEWHRLEKKFVENLKRKVDSEVLAMLRRIEELMPEHLVESQKAAMRPCFKLVEQVRTESKHTEVQKKAEALFKRWKSLLSKMGKPEADEDVVKKRELLTEKMPQIYESAKKVEEMSSKPIRSVEGQDH